LLALPIYHSPTRLGLQEESFLLIHVLFLLTMYDSL